MQSHGQLGWPAPRVRSGLEIHLKTNCLPDIESHPHAPCHRIENSEPRQNRTFETDNQSQYIPLAKRGRLHEAQKLSQDFAILSQDHFRGVAY